MHAGRECRWFVKDFTSARAEIQKHNAEFFCHLPDFGKLQVLMATGREEYCIQEKTGYQ